MKGSEKFKEVIQNYLEARGQQDPLFAETLQKPNKSIDGCVEYILSEVQQSGCSGFADEEIFGMAIHYYDEDDLKTKKVSISKVVINHSVELSEEDLKVAKEKAMEKAIEEQKAKLTKKPDVKKPAKEAAIVSLFD